MDSDNGIYINGGALLASGNMYDEVSNDSEQAFVVLSFADSIEAGQMFALKNTDGDIITAFSAANDFQTLVYSSSELADGDYTLYEISSAEGTEVSGLYTEVTSIEDETQLQYASKNAGGFGGKGGAPMGGQAPNGQEGEAPSKPDGEAPSMPDGEAPDMAQGGDEEGGTVFTISGITNTFSNISKATESE